jgi:hypothetical protein
MDQANTPNWYRALQEHAWTVRNIQREFRVSRTIAQQIQHTHPTYEGARAVERAHGELTSQVGH